MFSWRKKKKKNISKLQLNKSGFSGGMGFPIAMYIYVYFRANLKEAAEILKGLGAINAINLDGGGSSTMVVNNTLISYPSDFW